LTAPVAPHSSHTFFAIGSIDGSEADRVFCDGAFISNSRTDGHLCKVATASRVLATHACELVADGLLFFMTSDERTLIATLFDRLNQAAAQPRDAEAEELIRGKVSQQPLAPYLLVQSTLVMQQALAAAQSRIADLEKQLAAAGRPGQGSGGSFLSGMANLFGVGQSPSQPPPRPPQTPPPLPTQPSPPSTFAPPPLPQAGPRGGGSFLQSALSTAAGVAGGALLFQGIQNLMGHNPGPFGGLTGPSGGLIGGNQPVTENTEIVNEVVETNPPASGGEPAVAQEESASSLDPDASTADPDSSSQDDLFASDDGGDFFGDDDSFA
jgi:hypothetical protein